MSYKFEVGKEYKTRDGRRAVVLSDQYPCYGRPTPETLVGVLQSHLDHWLPWSWKLDGHANSGILRNDDLMPPKPREFWIALSSNPSSGYATAFREKFVADCLDRDRVPFMEIVHVREVQEEDR